MKKRPASITIIAWFFIVTGIGSLIVTIVTLGNSTVREVMSSTSLPLTVQYAMTFTGLFVSLVSGIGMLVAQNWARFLYVTWSVISNAIYLPASPMKLVIIPGIVVFLVVAFFLFRPRANEYFAGIQPEQDAVDEEKPFQSPL